ncbi:hypothetical protein XENOCAPTIV_024519 [Xenoophorus captivus]|uniref:Uncharacterized protein n=1 Tax=Xenoophorus captivus TaxID=1517983 RepID=A0ABV0SCH9_9TELE
MDQRIHSESSATHVLHVYLIDNNVFSTESTRQRAYSLVAQAYTSITAEDLAAFVGYSVEEAVKGETFLTATLE